METALVVTGPHTMILHKVPVDTVTIEANSLRTNHVGPDAVSLLRDGKLCCSTFNYFSYYVFVMHLHKQPIENSHVNSNCIC